MNFQPNDFGIDLAISFRRKCRRAHLSVSSFDHFLRDPSSVKKCGCQEKNGLQSLKSELGVLDVI